MHELLVLLAQPEVEVPETPMEPIEDPAVQVTLEAPPAMGRTTLNFLQEDELAIPDNVETDFVVVEPVSVPGSVPVSHCLLSLTRILPVAASFQYSAQANFQVNEQTGFDWTANDAENDEEAAAKMQEAFSSAATPEIDATADALEAVRLEGGADTPASSTGERKRAPRKRKPHGAKKENGSAAASGSEQAQQKGEGQQKQGQRQRKENGDKGDGKEGKPRQNRPRQPKKEKEAAASGPDEDGFQVQKPKTRQAKPAAGNRGRGGRPAGSNGRQGGAKENGGNGGQGKPRQPKEGADKAEPKPKPSIYKQTQPSGPSSAPIF